MLYRIEMEVRTLMKLKVSGKIIVVRIEGASSSTCTAVVSADGFILKY